jgi:hypothetical protein
LPAFSLRSGEDAGKQGESSFCSYLPSLAFLFFDAVRHGRRFAPEAPQRSEDSESVMASAIIFPSLQSLFFAAAGHSGIDMAS